jgi:lipid-A-disaccharide synthase
VSTKTLNVGIVATEHSGDLLGYSLIQSLSQLGNINLFGIGYEKLKSLGLKDPNIETQSLNVMGIIDPIKNLPKILENRKLLTNFLLDSQIDIFIGVDAPDFNMGMHKVMHSKNIHTIQLVSPSVWAWRRGRIKKIKKYIDCTFCLFPFEKRFYDESNTQAMFVGHPFSEINISDEDKSQAQYIALLPGSRDSELKHMLPIMIDFAKLLAKTYAEAHFLIPAASSDHRDLISKLFSEAGINFTCSLKSMQEFLIKSPISVVTSGTATLEAACYGSSPIICYKTGSLNYSILSRLNKAPFIGLPNLILDNLVFPELIQDQCTAHNILECYQELSASQTRRQNLEKIKLAIQGEGFSSAASYIFSLA